MFVYVVEVEKLFYGVYSSIEAAKHAFSVVAGLNKVTFDFEDIDEDNFDILVDWNDDNVFARYNVKCAPFDCICLSPLP